MNITTSKTTVGGTIVTPPRRKWRVSGALAWVAVTPFAAWAVARVAGLERGTFAAQIMTATPYAAAGSLVPLMLAAMAKKRAAAAIALVSTAALGFSVLPRAFSSAQPELTGPTLKVMSSNLLFGHADAATVVGLVRKLQPDVLSTQELTPAAVEALDAAGLKELMPYRVLKDEWSAAGSGLYARYPLTQLDDLFHPVGHNMPAAAMTLPGDDKVEIVDVHTFTPLGPQVAQWSEGLRNLPSAPKSGAFRVLVGDFNASLDHNEMRKVVARGYSDAADATGEGLIATWPANKRVPPIITIDHLLADQRLAVSSYRVLDVPDTDHRAIFVELRLPATN